jgi:hypothetical protein
VTCFFLNSFQGLPFRADIVRSRIPTSNQSEWEPIISVPNIERYRAENVPAYPTLLTNLSSVVNEDTPFNLSYSPTTGKLSFGLDIDDMQFFEMRNGDY